jgi:Tol biopolymer transport system component
MLGSLPLARDVSVPRSGGELELVDYGGIASVPLSVVSLATGRERVLPLRGADFPKGGGGIVWSPDGRKVAVIEQGGVLAVADVRTGATRTLLDASAAPGMLDDWSPDGTTLLATGGGRLELIDGETGIVRDLVAGVGGVFSPDGSEVAYVDPGSGVNIVNVASGTVRTVAPLSDAARAISWSPAGNQVVYTEGGGGAPFKVVVVGADGSPAPRVLGTSDLPFTLFWAGRLLVWRTLPGGADPAARVAVSDPVTGTVRTFNPLPAGTGLITPLASLPGGNRIVYELDAPGGAYHRTVGVDGRDDAPLLPCRGLGHNDIVIGTRLNDVINARNASRDTVRCGQGHDIVIADRNDRVARDCETVRH